MLVATWSLVFSRASGSTQLLPLCDWSRHLNPRRPLNQLDEKLKQNASCCLAFSRASKKLFWSRHLRLRRPLNQLDEELKQNTSFCLAFFPRLEEIVFLLHSVLPLLLKETFVFVLTGFCNYFGIRFTILQ